jgi:membrane-associated phospholipid phosphatase
MTPRRKSEGESMARTMVRGIALMIAIGLGASGTARAQEAGGTLDYDWKVDGTITVVGGLGWALTEGLKVHLSPDECRWCDRDGVNGLDGSVRDWLKWDDIDAGNSWSNVTAFGLAPASALGLTALIAYHDDRLDEWAPDALIVLESTALAADVNQIVKFSVGRQRPLVHFGHAYDKADANLSFYSGHTNLAFALAVSSGTVASMRGYRFAPVVWISGLAIAGTTGYLRIAGDRHYFTDVITGAAMGSLIGFAVPYFFHRHGSSRASAAMLPAGSMVLGWSGMW